MCGIAGVADPRLDADALAPLVRSMTERLVHRGPDDDGYRVQAGVGLGMRRLSIIDLAGGAQPIHNEDGSLCIVFNGEIFNYKDLRRELEAKGHRFRTRSDTETILHLYEEEGPAGFARLRGQFAFAILHEASQELILARDHLGIAPLFYRHDGDRLWFASELKALREAGGDGALRASALEEFFALRYVLAPGSIYAGFERLAPGHYLRWRQGVVEQRPFWTLRFAEPSLELSDDAFAERTAELLSEAVGLRMQSDVPFGAFLSGGLDSSLIVALMSERAHPINTFSVGFARKGKNEYRYSRQVARRFRTDHVEHTVDPAEFAAVLPRVQAATDEPVGDPAYLPLHCIAERAAAKVKVVLSGEGADEVFGGYGRYQQLLDDGVPLDAARFETYLKHCSYFLDDLPLADDLLDSLRGERLRDRLHASFAECRVGYLNRLLHFDLLTWMPDNLLVKADRMGMANSLEVRVPYLDVPLLEHMSAAPERLKIRRVTRRRWLRSEQEWQVKALLKDVARGKLPDRIIHREKVGFPVPVRWLLKHPLRPLVTRLLDSPRITHSGIFDAERVNATLRRFLDHGKGPWPVWTLVCFDAWCESAGIAKPHVSP